MHFRAKKKQFLLLGIISSSGLKIFNTFKYQGKSAFNGKIN
jgi:hypothetical protein